MLIGLFSLLLSVSVTMQVSSDFFHSRLGNQQFNHYPAKFPTQNVCEFLQRFYEDYSEYCEHVVNLPRKGECPIAPRKIYVHNKPFPAKAVPPFFPTGLWKVQMAHTLNNIEIPVCEFIDNFYADYSKYVDDMINLPRKGECPIAPRIIYVLNKPFPSKAVPPFFPSGLWKTQILITLNDVEIARLGNQQFNHYPVKFPTQQVCKFLENFYTDYSEYVDDFENLPAKGECPIKPCKIDILNKPFPAKAVTSDLFHSSRGNQQFNHYPVKFPTQNVCEFLENFYKDYSEYVDDLDNLPAKGECPIKPCKVDILNKPFPAKAVPPFFPSGLWKAQIKLTMNDVEIARFELIIKARQDLGM
uniref:Spaetzle domain-containing protein n=1 Tax=Anopheles quadriannulatus TaxID=34691 RepID=A0A182XGV6_ANOQN